MFRVVVVVQINWWKIITVFKMSCLLSKSYKTRGSVYLVEELEMNILSKIAFEHVGLQTSSGALLFSTNRISGTPMLKLNIFLSVVTLKTCSIDLGILSTYSWNYYLSSNSLHQCTFITGIISLRHKISWSHNYCHVLLCIQYCRHF